MYYRKWKDFRPKKGMKKFIPMIKFCIICLLFSLISCGKGLLLTAPAYVLNPAAIDTSKLRFDGFYSMVNEKYPSSKYTAESEVVFTINNKIFNSYGANTTDIVFTCERYKNIRKDRIGTYTIEGNKIKAFVPTVVTIGDGAKYLLYNLNYEGTIQNKELITDWHAVPPFPQKFGKGIFNSFQNNETFEPQVMKFVNTEAVRCLQSK